MIYETVILPLGQKFEVAAPPMDWQDEHGVMIGPAYHIGYLLTMCMYLSFYRTSAVLATRGSWYSIHMLRT